MEEQGLKPSEDSVVSVKERNSKKDRVTEIKPAQRRIRAPRKGTSLLVAGSLLLGGAAALINRGGSHESQRTPTEQEAGNTLTIDSGSRESLHPPMQEADRQPIILESRERIDSSSAPFAISYESMGLAGKFDASSNSLVDVPTKIVASDEKSKEVVILAEIRRDVNGNILMKDISPTGMDTKAQQWFKETMARVLPVLDVGFDVGGFYTMTIGTQKSPGETFANHSQSDSRNKNLFIDLNMVDKTIDPEDFQATILHEAAHSITEKKPIVNPREEFKPHPSEVKSFSEACSAVRDFAVDELEMQADGFISEMEKIGENIPKFKPAADQLIQGIREKRLNGFFPQQDGEGEFSGVNTCNFIGGTGLLMDASKAFSVHFDPEQATQEEKDTLQGVDVLMKKFVHKESIYRAITDATYVMDPMAGHPYDNLDEAAASMFAITLIAPEELGKVISTLPPEGQEVIIKFYNISMQLFTDTSDKLAHILRPYIDKVTKVDFRAGIQNAVEEALEKSADNKAA